jgi:hypothetical protein
MMNSAQAPADGETQVQTDSEEQPESSWLAMSRDAFDTSCDYYDAEVRKQVEKSVSHFHGKHPAGSKYLSAAYKFRSKGFRPKTRAIIRRNEAAAAAALFSTVDAVDIQPELEMDEAQRVSATLLKDLLAYRLDNSIPWFRTALGAYQDSLTTGTVISHQYWDFEESSNYTPITQDDGEYVLDDEGGVALTEDREVVSDKPVIELRPVENVRFSPASDWTDPINSSPYLIDRFPMHIGDIKQRMKQDGKGQSAWHTLSDGQLAMGTSDTQESTHKNRNRTNTDRDQRHSVTDFDIAWIHRNIIRHEGTDVIFYTLGTHFLLSDPIPLREEYFHLGAGERPYVMGSAVVEAHRTYAAGLAELMGSLQQEANEINNQRRDNVALALNRRYYARRGATIDYRSLTRNVPGSITLVDDINKDIRSDVIPDVTGSSYQEQDRINMDYDELAGSFSTSSVGTNRQLNETVGGMSMLSEGANAIMEYQLRTFVETWVEPVLKQLVKLEQGYETDEGLLAMMGERQKLWQKYGVDDVTDLMLQGSMTVRVNVGFGATNPQKRLEKLTAGLNTVREFMPDALSGADPQEVIKEVFGALGYRSSERFFPVSDEQDPQVAQLQQQIQQMQQLLEGKQLEQQEKTKVEMAKLQVQQGKVQIDSEIDQARLGQDRELKMMDMALKRDLTIAQLQAKLEIDAKNAEYKQIDAVQRVQAQEREAAIKLMEQNTRRMSEKNKANELNFKASTGRQGI